MELILSSKGRLYIEIFSDDSMEYDLKELFRSCESQGLLQLARLKGIKERTPSFQFWTLFVNKFLQAACLYAAEDKEDHSMIPMPDHIKLNWQFQELEGHCFLNEAILTDKWNHLATKLFSLSKKHSSLRSYIDHAFPKLTDAYQLFFHLAEQPENSVLPFCFLATWSHRHPDKVRTQHIPLGQLVNNPNHKDLLPRIFKTVNELQPQSRFLEKLMNQQGLFSVSSLTGQQAFLFLEEAELFQQHGISVRFPQSFQATPPKKAELVVELNEASDSKPTLGLQSLYKISARYQIKDQQLNEKEKEEILEADGLIKIRGKWIKVDRQRLDHMMNHWQQISALKQHGLSLKEALGYIAGINRSGDGSVEQQKEETHEVFQLSPQSQSKLKTLWAPQSHPQKDQIIERLQNTVKATLRPYQLDGVLWLHSLMELGFGGCLADDMGLGKTLQVLSALSLSPSDKPHLIILPASLLGNWEKEIRNFVPHLNYFIFHPSSHSQSELTLFEQSDSKVDLLITTYYYALNRSFFHGLSYQSIIVDEAQILKNPSTKLSQCLRKFESNSKIALTGTPIENKIIDLYALFAFSCPGLLGSKSRFLQYYQSLNEKKDFKPLKDLIKPFILRRVKTDKTIINDLPQKTEMKTYCTLSKTQFELYKKTTQDLIASLKNQDTSIERHGMIINYLLKFKKICNHPSQLTQDDQFNSADSGKMERLKQVATQIKAQRQKLLLFTQFSEIIDILDDLLLKIFKKPGLTLDGSTPIKQRQKLVDQFQNPLGPDYFILSLKAGGSGLNLTEACHVIHFDRWWNPAVENQATDRIFRIGQKNNVMVHKLICKGTIEEKIDDLIDFKQHLSDDILRPNQELPLSGLNDQELLNIIQLNPLLQGAESHVQ